MAKLQQCYNKVTTKLQQSYSKVTAKLRQSYGKVTAKLRQSYSKVMAKLQQSYGKEVESIGCDLSYLALFQMMKECSRWVRLPSARSARPSQRVAT